MSDPVDKVYVLVRGDLPMGSQLAQAIHAQDEFRSLHPEVHEEWRRTSNTIVVLHLRDEDHLHDLHQKAATRDIPCAVFREPDLEDAATCLVLGPTPYTRRLTARLPLAG